MDDNQKIQEVGAVVKKHFPDARFILALAPDGELFGGYVTDMDDSDAITLLRVTADKIICEAVIRDTTPKSEVLH